MFRERANNPTVNGRKNRISHNHIVSGYRADDGIAVEMRVDAYEVAIGNRPGDDTRISRLFRVSNDLCEIQLARSSVKSSRRRLESEEFTMNVPTLFTTGSAGSL